MTNAPVRWLARVPLMSPALRTVFLLGLGLSALTWLAFVLIQLLHAESVAIPVTALLITGFLIVAVCGRSRLLASLASLLSLLPLVLLLAQSLMGSGFTPAPLLVHFLLWSWALFHGYVAICLALQAARSGLEP